MELFNFSFISVTGCGIGLDYCDTEWFTLEMNRDHSVVFETASKYCISDSFVDHYSTHGYNQKVNTKIRLIISLQPKMEKLYIVSKNKTRS